MYFYITVVAARKEEEDDKPSKQKMCLQLLIKFCLNVYLSDCFVQNMKNK